MDETMGVSSGLFGIFCFVSLASGQEQCTGDLRCEQGHCCGRNGTHCCTYYYELWWFWMIWGLIIVLSGCCLFQQHRLKKRQHRAHRMLQLGLQDGTFLGLSSTVAHTHVSTSSAEHYGQSELRLPTYDEVRDFPKDPPAYEMLFEAGRNVQDPIAHFEAANEAANVTTDTQHSTSSQTFTNRPSSSQNVNDSENVSLLNNESVPEEDPPPAYTAT